MNDSQTNTDTTWITNLGARAAGLNELGEHYFAGWLISAGFQKPDVMAEIEALLKVMETDPALQYRPNAQDPMSVLQAAGESIPSPVPQIPAVPCVDAPAPPAFSEQPCPLGDLVRFEQKPAKRLPFPARLLAAIFPKRRLAA